MPEPSVLAEYGYPGKRPLGHLSQAEGIVKLPVGGASPGIQRLILEPWNGKLYNRR